MAGTTPHREGDASTPAPCSCPDDCGCAAHVADYSGSDHACREFLPFTGGNGWTDVTVYRFSE